MTDDVLPAHALRQTGPAPRPENPPLPEIKTNRDLEYGLATSRYSWFLDLAAIAARESAIEHGLEQAQTYGGRVSPTPEWISPRVPDVDAAMRRVHAEAKFVAAEAQKYAMSTAGGSGGGFARFSGGSPEFVSEAFTLAARNAGVLTGILPSGDLPDSGMAVGTGRLDSGASTAALASEGGAGSNTDPTSSLVTSPLALIQGHVDISQQLLDQSDPAMTDVVLALELGAAFAANVDSQILSGTALNGQTQGILGASGTGSVTASTASVVSLTAKILEGASTVATNAGVVADTVLMHPRRTAYMRQNHATEFRRVEDLGLRLVDVPNIPTNLGGSTNEDRIIVLNLAAAVSVFLSPVSFSVYADVLSGTLQARAQVRGYLASVVRQPKAIAILSGAGLVTPAFA